MKQTIALALAALAPLALTTTAAAQRADEAGAGGRQAQQASEQPLEVEYFRPQKAEPAELARLAQQLFSNGFRGAGFGGPLSGSPTILHFGETVLVRGYEPQVLEVVRQLTRLDAEWKASPQREQLEILNYRVRHVSMDSIGQALDPFERPIQGDANTVKGGVPMLSLNVSMLRERGIVIVRDTPERLKMIEGVLRSIDVPGEQLFVTAYVVHGNSETKEDDERLPPDLLRDLERLVPFSGFELLSIGFLRSDGVGAMSLQVELQGGADFQLQLRPQAYDPTEGALSLSSCEFEIVERTGQSRKRRFSTSARLRQGEYTVLGGLGNTPVLVVLRLTPQQG